MFFLLIEVKYHALHCINDRYECIISARKENILPFFSTKSYVTPKQVNTELYATPHLTNLLSNDFLQDLFHSNWYYFSCYFFNHVIF